MFVVIFFLGYASIFFICSIFVLLSAYVKKNRKLPAGFADMAKGNENHRASKILVFFGFLFLFVSLSACLVSRTIAGEGVLGFSNLIVAMLSMVLGVSALGAILSVKDVVDNIVRRRIVNISLILLMFSLSVFFYFVYK